MSAKPKILVVDDEPQIHRFLRPSLSAAGYAVSSAMTAAEAVTVARALGPALLIVDLGLPDRDGKDLVEELRSFTDAPVIVLSARDRESEKIAALDAGADDYIEKPFGIGELLARLRSALRRRSPSDLASAVTISVGTLEINAAAHRVTRQGAAVSLTPKEFDLLATLARHPGRVITHRQLLAMVWGPAHVTDVAYLRVFIGQLRQKIEIDPASPKLILTAPGVGYRFADLQDGG